MKKIISLIMIILLTGCGVKYQININSDSVEEQISFDLVVDKDKSSDELELDMDSMDNIKSIEELDIPVFEDNNNILYTKEITNNGNLYNIKLSYKYNKNQYKYSRIINECFENHIVSFDNNKTYIHLSGAFYCFQDENIDIVVKTGNIVNKSNGSKSGDSYHWTINKDNYNNVDIEIEISNKSKVKVYIYYGIIIVVLLGLFYFGYKLYVNIVNRRDVNRV